MVTIEIDGQKLEAKNGQMLIQVADEAGISIPRFCYHKKLSIAANCRMCLVDVEKAPKPLPACATPVMDGMIVRTQSQKALDAQESVMEFLLINHPLDCPICDQGGECELQDVAMGYGTDVSRYSEGKRVVKDKDIGPLVATDMTRCIHCTRCVRFGQEIAGIRELGATGRGEHTQIGTFLEKSVDSELSGNIIDLCPVGALTSKPYRFTARAWELAQRPSIAAHDCVGSNLYAHVRDNQVVRVVPRDNEAINEVWLSDRDRYAYVGFNSEDRLELPLVKKHGQWQTSTWKGAFDFALTGLKGVQSELGGGAIGALLSPSSTLEEAYLLQKMMRGLGSSNIDHRLHELDFSDQDKMPQMPLLGQTIHDLESLNACLLIGSNIRKEQPLLAHRLRKAALAGAKIHAVNPEAYEFHFDMAEVSVPKSADLLSELYGIANALLQAGISNALEPFKQVVEKNTPSQAQKRIASSLSKAAKSALLLGPQALNSAEASCLRSVAQAISEATNSRLGFLTEGANSAGAYLAGAVPHRAPFGVTLPENQQGKSCSQMLSVPLKAYVLFALEPDFDVAASSKLLDALQAADFVLVLSPYVTEKLKSIADAILPIATVAETSGTFINVEGKAQSFLGVAEPFGEARPGWKVLRVLGNWLGLDGFEYKNSQIVLEELMSMGKLELASQYLNEKVKLREKTCNDECTLITAWSVHAVDSVVRRSTPLQLTRDSGQAVFRVHPKTAERFGLVEKQLAVARQEGASFSLPVLTDTRLAENTVSLSLGIRECASVGLTSGPVEIVHMHKE